MKKLLIFLFALMISGLSFGQITVSGSVGADGTYTSLTNAAGAFLAINGTAQTGANILITVDADVTTEAGTNSLNAGAWTTLTINPSGGAARTISGTVAGAPMIIFNGADNVNIDGLNTGGNSLTIANLSTSSTSATSTIRLFADATNNTITNCSILGSATMTLATNGGNIFISTGTSTGNDNITISNCKIGPAGTNLPSKGIYGNGSTTSSAIANSNVTITNCEIYDYFLTSGCAGVYVSTGNTDWNVTNNKIYQTASRTFTAAGTMNGIYFSNSTFGNNIQITGNTIGYASNSGTGTLTLLGSGFAGAFQGIYMNAMTTAANACNLNNNTISNISLTSSTGTFYSVYNASGASSNTININNNTIKNIELITTTGSWYGIAWASATNMTITGNNIYDITRNGAGTMYGIYSGSSSVNETVSNNNVYNLSATSATTTSTIYGIYQLTAAGTKVFQNNTIHDLTGNFGNTIYGISVSYGTTVDISDNTIYSLNATGGTAGTIYGMNLGTSAAAMNVYKNKIYNISSTSTGPAIYGVVVAGGTTRNIYNNFIGSLTASAANVADAIRGINITSSAASSNVNVYYNSIYINAASSGINFGTTGIYHTTSATATTAALDMRNNIIVNTSTPNGTGITVAYRRSSTTLTNYASTSNANAFYAGAVEDATHAVFYDGTTIYSFAAYQTLVGPSRDAVSFRELPPFIGGAPYDLHLNTAIATYCESGGLAVSSPISITTDFDGNARSSTPDVGADEFAGIAAGVINPALSAAVASSQQINLTFTPNPSVNNVVIVWNATGTFTAPSGPPPAPGNAFAGGTLLYDGTTSPFNHTGLTPATAYYYKAFSYDGANYSSGVTATATPSVAAPTAFTATPASSSQINLAYTKNVAGNDVIVATNNTSTFGAPVNGTPLNVSDPITGGGTIIYKGSLAAFNHTSLTASTAYYYKVWSVDAFDYYSATGATANATTYCSAETAPTTVQTFATFTGSAPAPTCWTEATGILAASSTLTYVNSEWLNSTGFANTGTNVGVKTNLYSTGNEWIISQPIDLGGTAGLHRVKYDMAVTSYNGTASQATLGTHKVDVVVSVDGGSTWSNTNVIKTYTGVGTYSNTGQSETVDLTTYSGIVKIAFVATTSSTTPDIDFHIDNFLVEAIPSCNNPTGVTSSAITTTTATISWTAAAPAPANGYEWEVRTSGAGGSGATGLVQSGSTIAGDVNDDLTGLSASTQYFVYVRSYCGVGDYSPWTSSYSFTTLCDAVTSFPWSEGFEGAFAPNCWTNASWEQSTYGAAHTGLEWAYSNLSGSLLTTPGFALSNNSTFKYWYRVESATYPQDMDVLLSTDGINFTTVVSHLVGVTNIAYTQVSIDLTAYTGQTVYLRFNGLYGTGGAAYGICVDDVSVEAIPAGIWSGTANTSWNNTANWTSGTIPTLTDNVVINSGAPNMPIVDLAPATPAVCSDLTINAGATLEIASGKALTAYGVTTITGTFTIKSDVSGTGSFINIGSITGNVTVEKFLPAGRWWYVGTPVAASTGAGAFTSLSAVASTGNRLMYRDEPNFQYLAVADADVLTPMKGYTFRTFGADVTALYTGALNTGNYGAPNNLSRTLAVAFAGYNLISNPYPSAINWGSSASPTTGLTQTNMETTIWYKANLTFATYNWQGGIDANGGQREVPAMQSFWVRVSSGNTAGGIQLTNSTRIHSAQAFYKTNTMDNVFRMTINSNNITDEAVVCFFDNAQAAYENYDSEKMFSDEASAPQIYTLTSDNTQAIINGFPVLGVNEIRVVPMGFKTDVAGTFTFDATNLTDFDASIPVSLEDLTTGIMQDLRQNASYSFTSGAVNTANRFRLHFGTMTTGVTENENASVAIYAYGNTMYVNTPQINSVIDVYDMVGNKVLSQISKAGMNTIQAGLKSGMYLVKVQSNNGVVNTEKVVITK